MKQNQERQISSTALIHAQRYFSTGAIGVLVSNFVLLFALMIAVVIAADPAQAEKMDAEIHTVVIQKLEQALTRVREDETISLKPVRARLADLYADRARLRAMNEAENNCTACKGAREDRQKALNLYERVVVEAAKENRGPLILQMAQLSELNTNFKKAESLYNEIVSEGVTKHSKEVIAEGFIGRAEARFARGDLNRAQSDFESALKLVGTGRKGQILHRIGWCQLNKGEQVQAVHTLIHILETGDLLTRDSSEGASFDSSFQEDIARDLATFLARGSVSRREISLLESLTPEAARRETMKHFANECDRLGQKKVALEAWMVEAKYEETTSARLEALVRIAQIRFDLGQKQQAFQGIQSSVKFWKEKGCDEAETCKSIQNRIRMLVVNWNKSEKKNPSSLLVDAYLAYLDGFSDDMEMTQWAAEIARVQKRYGTAATLYHKGAILAFDSMASNSVASSASKIKSARSVLENGLVGEVEMAELSKDPMTRERSYNHYLELNPNGAIHAKIRYQRAHVAYEKGDMNEASARFHEFASSAFCKIKLAEKPKALCLQAADLDLDALVGLKAHAIVQARGTEYAHLFPKRQGEFLKITRTAVLKQAEGQEPKSAIAKLAEADLTGATTAERVRFLKTWLSLAEKSHDLVGARVAAGHLLNTKGLSGQEYEFALGKIAWVAETTLNFNEAFQVVKKMKLAGLRPEERAMKLSLLADLSGNDSRPYDDEILRKSRDSQQKSAIRVKLVRSSKRPLVELAKHEAALRSSPTLYAQLALEVFAKTGNYAIASRAVSIKAVAKEPAGRVLVRELFIHEFTQIDNIIARHQLETFSELATQKSLIQRLNLVAGAEKVANKAIAIHDWTSQVLALSMLVREEQRLYKEIIKLPVPKKLKGVERTQYTKLIEAKARGFQHKSDEVSKKVDLLWGQSQAQAAIESDMKTVQSPAVRALLANELRRLSFVAPSAIRRQLTEELEMKSSIPSEQQVALARQEAKERPFNFQAIARLRDLEVVRGGETIVAYLDARLLTLKNGEKKTGEKR